MQLYSVFNDHYCEEDSFSGLCNQNSMVYNARIVVRLFYHRGWNVHEVTGKKFENIFVLSTLMPRRMKPIILITGHSAELK